MRRRIWSRYALLCQYKMIHFYSPSKSSFTFTGNVLSTAVNKSRRNMSKILTVICNVSVIHVLLPKYFLWSCISLLTINYLNKMFYLVVGLSTWLHWQGVVHTSTTDPNNKIMRGTLRLSSPTPHNNSGGNLLTAQSYRSAPVINWVCAWPQLWGIASWAVWLSPRRGKKG